MNAAGIQARLKSGALSKERVQWAARLGHAAAGKVTGLRPGQDDPLVGCLQGKVLTAGELRRFACDCVERLLPHWERERPGVSRPRELVEALRALADAGDDARLVELGREAYGLRNLQVSDGADLVLTGLYCAAMPNAVDAARQALDDLTDGVALLAMDAAQTDDEEVGHAAAEAEYAWQSARLCDYLLGAGGTAAQAPSAPKPKAAAKQAAPKPKAAAKQAAPKKKAAAKQAAPKPNAAAKPKAKAAARTKRAAASEKRASKKAVAPKTTAKKKSR